MGIDTSRLASVIFDRGQKISQKDYMTICESIEMDKLTLNECVIEYKKRDAICENLFFTLNDGSRILIEENVINIIRGLNMDTGLLLEYMSESSENFNKVIREIISNGF